MRTTLYYLQKVKTTRGITSDYALAKCLGVNKQSIYGYQNGWVLRDEICLAVAKELEIDPIDILLAIWVERAKRDESKPLEKVYRKIAKLYATPPTMPAGMAGEVLSDSSFHHRRLSHTANT